MTDRELLEYAAKAAGIDVYDSNSAGIKIRGILGLWNSLTNEGDAFRLAIYLDFDIRCDRRTGFVSVASENFVVDERIACDGSDQAEKTMLAITKAAAEIGKAMESK